MQNVGIDTLNGAVGEGFPYLFFNIFRADARVARLDGAAFGAGTRRLCRPSAVVALHQPLAFMKGERHRTVFTQELVSAVLTLKEMREPAAVQKENGLFPLRFGVAHFIDQRSA